MAEKWNENEIDRLIKQASDAVQNPEELKKAAQGKSREKVLGSLKPEQARRLQGVLANDAEVKRLLSTPQAQELLKKLMGDDSRPGAKK